MIVDLARELAPRVRAAADQTEADRGLSAELTEALARAGLFRSLVPAALGGGEVRPWEFVATLEELAAADGATAWVVMTSATTGLLLAYLDPETATELSATAAEAPLAGVFAPTGRAEVDGDGYRLSGRWRYGSGCGRARWRMGGAWVVSETGREARSFFFRSDESTVIDTWRTAGLRGTGSHDMAVEDVFIPRERTVSVLSERPRHDGPLYRLPIFGLLAAGVSAVGLGLGRAALAQYAELARTKRSRGGGRSLAESELVQVSLAEADARLAAARALLHTCLREAFEVAVAGEVGTSERARLRQAATFAAHTSAAVVDVAYHGAGGASIWDTHPLSRIFRDVHVMTQHLMVAKETYKPVGRLQLGLETDVSQL